ncbi:GNAT family N-acetyltransferase [Lentimicrobium sp. S6]|uniref:GNAT family N-acetyltransferase n=1 Tax=Lentimicrobium sp. S6 TaxID=2735872 RepID=UPI001551DD5A|nr:GNAT family N-acetyltransferase [Lentimicrobium sp. S6]NPD48066.1 GNAT family N-acetyltransferase [Lentimicrobium sp. S6]
MNPLNHKFILVFLKEKVVGFASYELNYQDLKQLMIHKVYILPNVQGRGLGKKLFVYLTEIGLKNKQKKLRLKVFHKNDKAIRFYEKNGYVNDGIEKSDIGNNYIVLDYVLTKKLKDEMPASNICL